MCTCVSVTKNNRQYVKILKFWWKAKTLRNLQAKSKKAYGREIETDKEKQEKLQ